MINVIPAKLQCPVGTRAVSHQTEPNKEARRMSGGLKEVRETDGRGEKRETEGRRK